MSWEKLDTDRFIDDGIIDKAGLCLEAIVKQSKQQKLGKPGYMEFINQFKSALKGCAKGTFILEDNMYFDGVEAGFNDFSKLQSGDHISGVYEFIQDLICDAIAKMRAEYEHEFKRQPYLQEIMAAFSRVAVGSPKSYFSDGGRIPLLYIKAIQKSA
jgi:hypothetical protein